MATDWVNLKFENDFIKKIRCICINKEIIYLIFINELNYISEKLSPGPYTKIINNFLDINRYDIIKWKFQNIKNINNYYKK